VMQGENSSDQSSSADERRWASVAAEAVGAKA
jgi:hypothetical protein